MIRECFRHGKHGRWYTSRVGYLCGICQCESVRRAGAKKNYKRVMEAQGALMADAYMSAVNAGLSVNVKPYLNGTAPAVEFPPRPETIPVRVGRGSGRALTVAKFSHTDLDGDCVCDRCLNPPPANGILKAKMLVGPGDGGKKTRDNVMILCPVCRSLTISAMKRSAPPVWDGNGWVWPQVLPQDVENLWLYAAKWMTPEQRVQYANRSIEVGMGTERDVTYDALHGPASVGARFIYPAERPDLGREGARKYGPRGNGATHA